MAEGIGNKLKGKLVCESGSHHEENDGVEFGDLLERLNLGQRKRKLIVLALGGLLCHRVYRYDRSSVPRSRLPDTSYGSILVYKRPYCEDFMKFCLDRFEVGIWSSAREWYLNNALDCIMEGLKGKLLFAWDQNECTRSGFCTLEKKDKPLFLKDLNKLWQNKYLCKGTFSSSNTLLIDDKPYKALLNPSNTSLFIEHEYKVDDVDDMTLGPNSELRLYLDELAKAADDIPCYVEKHPFGQPDITPRHPDWNFYSKVVRSFGKASS
ncbi:uncharacterized protein LOC133831764 isoform X1 [Humulus lupulus]|uniref:uncharacterized protein LOC133831764 isoform X1 n=1 Tax=Humulus lupulus TaxID=3486 RepID=UPI002B41189E|nr:uncharacterized protein LOC133831764 isoform X1 [Humulus lupulus]XP_062118156.1 uncharacterized protein LOC133831764 isoform X1 [Humulus lupulus]